MRLPTILLAATLLMAAPVFAQDTTAGQATATAAGTPTAGVTLTFSKALQTALSAPDVRTAAANLAIARSRLSAQEAPVQANLSVDSGAGWDLANGGSSYSASVAANATFNVVPYGPSADALARARASVTRANASLVSTTNATVVAAATQYQAALRAIETVTVQQEALALAQAKLQAEQARYQAGAASDADVLAAQLDVASATDDLATAQRSARRALSALSQTLGVHVDGVDGGATQVLDPTALGATADIAKRSDVIGATVDVTSARLDLVGAQRDAGIDVSATISYSGSTDAAGLKLSAGFDTASFQPTAGATLNVATAGTSSSSLAASVRFDIPIDGGNTATIAAYQRALELASANLVQVRDAASVDIAEARRSLDGETQQLELQDALVEQAQGVLARTKQRFDLGLVSTLDVGTANLALHEAQLARDRSADSTLVAGLQLAQAMALDPMEVLK